MKFKCLFILVLSVLLAACSTFRQAATPLSERDTLIVVRVDTFVRSFPLYVADTAFTEREIAAIRDSLKFKFDWEHATTEVSILRDTVWRIRVKTQVKNDTIYRERVDTIFREKITHPCPTLPAVPVDGNIPWWALVALACGLFFFFMGKASRKE